MWGSHAAAGGQGKGHLQAQACLPARQSLGALTMPDHASLGLVAVPSVGRCTPPNPRAHQSAGWSQHECRGWENQHTGFLVPLSPRTVHQALAGGGVGSQHRPSSCQAVARNDSTSNTTVEMYLEPPADLGWAAEVEAVEHRSPALATDVTAFRSGQRGAASPACRRSRQVGRGFAQRQGCSLVFMPETGALGLRVDPLGQDPVRLRCLMIFVAC